jgi:hypothetical protein
LNFSTGQFNGTSYGSVASKFTTDSDATFNGDIIWKGKNIGEMLSAIEKRLNILVPDPAKLAHFEALQKAYDHYKMLESLCDLPVAKDGK